MASSRLRRNLVLSVEDPNRLVTDTKEILEVFQTSMNSILGSYTLVAEFDTAVLYPTNPDLTFLQEPFSTQELQMAVQQLANNKSSGPNGLPNEFLKLYWNDLKQEIESIFGNFFENRLDLRSCNVANIIMVPKTEVSKNTADFRPISIINLIPKLISKVLSNRLITVLVVRSQRTDGLCAWSSDLRELHYHKGAVASHSPLKSLGNIC